MAVFRLLVALAVALAPSAAWAQQRCEIGSHVPATSTFYLDANGNGAWDGVAGGDAETQVHPALGAGVPLVGDWNGDGFDDVGKQVGTVYALDLDGDGVWEDAAGGDRSANFAPAFGVGTPIVGDWDGDGDAEIGTFIAAESRFLLDVNGNGLWDGSAGGDRNTRFATFRNAVTAQPLIGDWNGDGRDDIGWRWPGGTEIFFDANGNGVWDGEDVDRKYSTSKVTDRIVVLHQGDAPDSFAGWVARNSGFVLSSYQPPARFAAFTGIGDPLVCDWNADGSDEVGKVVASTRFFLDRDGNHDWLGDAAGDQTAIFDVGVAAEPLAGRWIHP